MNNLIEFKLKRVEKQYKKFYKHGGLNLSLDEINKNYIHNSNYTTEKTYAEAYLKLINNKIS